MKFSLLHPGTRVVTRLRFTLLFIMVMATLAVSIGSLELYSLWRSQGKLLQRSIPSLLHMEELERALTGLLAATSELDKKQTDESLVRLESTIDQKNAALRDTIASLPGSGLVAPIHEEFRDAQRRLERAIVKLILLRQDVLHFTSALRENVVSLRRARVEFDSFMEPLVIDASTTLETNLALLDAEASGAPTTRRPSIVKDFALLNALRELAFQINYSIDTAEQLALTSDPAQFSLTANQLQFELRAITQLLLKLKDDQSRRMLAHKTKELRSLIFGSGGITQNLHELAKIRDRFATEKDSQLALTRTITETSNNFVALAKDEIEQTSTSLNHTLLTTLVTLLVTLIATFLVTAGVSYFVVEKQINRRMAGLIADVRRIASGNTEHAVSVTGPDEIGEMAKALEIFKANARELHRSNDELEKFAYVASRDLRSPLQAIRNLAEWTLEDAGDALPPDGRSNLKMMLQRVDRLARLLSDLLEYSRAGRAESNVAAMDVRKSVMDLAELVDPSGRFELKFSGNVKIVETHATPLRQILLNLINNATKHHDRDHGQITVDVQKVGPRIKFAVSDDGPGIDPDYHDRVFGLFETLKSRDEVEGSGLGLAIIRKLVEYYGGTITIASDPQQARGTTFTFDFPDMQDPANSQSAAEPKVAGREPVQPNERAANTEHPFGRMLPGRTLLHGQ